MVSLFLFALWVCSLKGIGCGDYGSEKSCNFRSKYSLFGCRYSGTSCSDATCYDYSDTDASSCKAAFGGTKCAYNASAGASYRCASADCDDFNDGTASECTSNYANLKCFYNGDETILDKCRPWRCTDYADAAACPSASSQSVGSSKCEWDATANSGAGQCKTVSCQDYYDASKDLATNNASCLASDGVNGLLSCFYNDSASSIYFKCSSASCSNFATNSGDVDQDKSACETNNGKMDCVFNSAYTAVLLRCSSRGCSDFTSSGDCEGSGLGCYWSSWTSRCSTLQCSELGSSKDVCESEHPVCHWDGGKCAEGEGDGAIMMSVSTLVMLLLLFTTFLAF